MSQSELAEKINISITHMSHIETANTKLSLPVFIDIVNALGVSANDLLEFNNQESKRSVYKERIDNLLSDASIEEQKMCFEIISSVKDIMKKNK